LLNFKKISKTSLKQFTPLSFKTIYSNKGVLEPCRIGIGNVFDKFCLGFLEGFSLLGKFTLHPAKLHLLIGGPLLKFGHLGLGRFYLLFQFHHPGAQRQDS